MRIFSNLDLLSATTMMMIPSNNNNNNNNSPRAERDQVLVLFQKVFGYAEAKALFQAAESCPAVAKLLSRHIYRLGQKPCPSPPFCTRSAWIRLLFDLRRLGETLTKTKPKGSNKTAVAQASGCQAPEKQLGALCQSLCIRNLPLADGDGEGERGAKQNGSEKKETKETKETMETMMHKRGIALRAVLSMKELEQWGVEIEIETGKGGKGNEKGKARSLVFLHSLSTTLSWKMFLCLFWILRCESVAAATLLEILLLEKEKCDKWLRELLIQQQSLSTSLSPSLPLGLDLDLDMGVGLRATAATPPPPGKELFTSQKASQKGKGKEGDEQDHSKDYSKGYSSYQYKIEYKLSSSFLFGLKSAFTMLHENENVGSCPVPSFSWSQAAEKMEKLYHEELERRRERKRRKRKSKGMMPEAEAETEEETEGEGRGLCLPFTKKQATIRREAIPTAPLLALLQREGELVRAGGSTR